MAYVHPQYPPPAPSTRPRASSTASGRYLPPGYQAPHQQASSASMRPEVGSMSPPHTYHPPRPEMYQSSASYQHPLPIGDHVRPGVRRAASDRPRVSSDSHHGSDSGRSHKSHHFRRSHREDLDTGKKSHDHREKQRAVSCDRASVRSRGSVRSKSSKRSHRSHHSLRNHFDDDVGKPIPPPKRRESRYPTLGGSLFALFSSMKKPLEK
ncbi:hypothetical protein CERZMDRAFT_95960 [Cercospora zeae-maydis SCOH1-5]|uniref:Uncharacterized protein n=1 Tax=Cercospora zeae-maydis SCOH1-5 TaxID=717836 RepID=A0A6A6FKM9_9PEZI|nr:hypothetical protein CERZMDRAFT_95960 [Cercospora zeae-maydis SCOH1-5]